MKRKTATVLLIILSAIICSAVVALTGCGEKSKSIDGVIKTVDGVILVGTSDGCYKVCGLGDDSITELVIPSVCDNYPVKEIDEEAFADCANITSVNIPDSVTTIGYGAFSECHNITGVTMGNGVTCVGDYAFRNCKNLKDITVSESVTSIGDDAFFGCSIENAVIPIIAMSYIPKTELKMVVITSCSSVDNSTFSGCSKLTSIVLSDGVTSIGDSAFEGCASLTSLSIPDSVTSIGDFAFESCSELNYIVYGNAKYLGNDNNPYYVLIGATNQNITTCGINKHTGMIYHSAFEGCTSLTSVIIPDGVTSIGVNVFYDCNNLTSANIPNRITAIGDYTFTNCSSLESMNIPDTVTCIGKYAFSHCESLASITIPDSVTSIGYGAFDDCESLTSLSVPFIGADISGTDKTHLGYIFGANDYSSNKWAVSQSLKSVIITGAINSVNEYAFSGCEYITNITLPDGLKSIGGFAFNDCSALTDINIPDSVTYIGDYAFDDCTYLNYGYYGNCKYLGNDNNPYLVLMGSVSKHTTKCTINKDTRIIYFNTFFGCEQLTSVIISDGVPYIGKGMYQGCMKLNSVTIPDSITFIDEYAFFCCESLTSIIIPDSVTSIGNYAFAYCYFTDVYFKGSKQQWAAIQIGSSNECLNIATIHYNYSE